VTEVLGRSANRSPRCHPKEAVYWFWKETIQGAPVSGGVRSLSPEVCVGPL